MAEIRAQLLRLCRRANLYTAQQALWLTASLVLLAGAALIAGSSRLIAPQFRLLTWIALLGIVAATVAALVWLRQHWLRPLPAARLADRCGQLQDRLTTLLSVRPSEIQSGLGPLLCAQLLERREQWLPERLLPRRLPRSFWLFAASSLVLLACLWNEQQRAAMTTGPDSATSPPQLADLTRLSAHDLAGEAGEPRAAGGVLRRGAGAGGADGQRARGDTTPDGGRARRARATAEGLASLPDRLQQALQQALAEPARGATGTGEADLDAGDAAIAGLGGARPISQLTEPNDADADAMKKGSANGAGARHDSRASPGAPPPASGEPAQGELFGEGLPAQVHPGQPFKLTLTTFLSGSGGGGPERQMPVGVGAEDGGASTGGGALHPQQREDDLLHKRDVPVEYEDVVRRAYARGADLDGD
ncbi:MAG TPA: hypothetical protein VEB21_09100 [Terriglobales bacterium]|nr:hypothetical protein [Terriglobales bacterium]